MENENKIRQLGGHLSLIQKRLHVAEKNNPATFDILNLSEAQALILMGPEDSMTMSEIAEATHLSLSSATSIIDKLEGKQFVRRERSNEDRRIVNVVLTKEGVRFQHVIKEGQLSLMRDMLNALDSQEQDQLIRLLGKIAANFSNLSKR